jgi:hypothetical protein
MATTTLLGPPVLRCASIKKLQAINADGPVAFATGSGPCQCPARRPVIVYPFDAAAPACRVCGRRRSLTPPGHRARAIHRSTMIRRRTPSPCARGRASSPRASRRIPRGRGSSRCAMRTEALSGLTCCRPTGCYPPWWCHSTHRSRRARRSAPRVVAAGRSAAATRAREIGVIAALVHSTLIAADHPLSVAPCVPATASGPAWSIRPNIFGSEDIDTGTGTIETAPNVFHSTIRLALENNTRHAEAGLPPGRWWPTNSRGWRLSARRAWSMQGFQSRILTPRGPRSSKAPRSSAAASRSGRVHEPNGPLRDGGR